MGFRGSTEELRACALQDWRGNKAFFEYSISEAKSLHGHGPAVRFETNDRTCLSTCVGSTQQVSPPLRKCLVAR